MKNNKKKGIFTVMMLVVLLAGCGRVEEAINQFTESTSQAYEEEKSQKATQEGTGSSTESGNKSTSEQLAEASDEQSAENQATEPALSVTEQDALAAEEPAEYDIQLMMLGDNLLHMGIVRTGKQEDGSYNFDFLFEGIEQFLAEAEIKMINQETILGGNHLGFSGYPYFNSPTEVGDAIAAAGFNIVLHASNHAADQNLEGLKNCVTFWEQYPEVLMAGIHEEGESPIQILTIEGIDFAVLNYTYGPNLETMPQEIEGHLDMLCNYDETTGRIDFTQLHPDVLIDIAKAKEMADVVIVCPHWGTEYTTKPSSYQQKFALQMTEAGADIIIGTHPHVVQPVEWIEAENGNRALCFYSLGNYVSTQKNPLCMLEAMAWISFRVTEEDIFIEEEKTGVLPMVCHYTANPVRLESVYLLEDYTEEKAAAHGISSYGGVNLYLGDLRAWSQEVFGKNVLTAEQVLSQ